MVGDSMKSIAAMRGNMVMRFALLFVCLAVCQAQQTSSSAPGVIAGVLSGDDGTVITGGNVMARRTSPSSERAWRTDWHTTSGDRGAFRFDGLPAGRYVFCARSPDSTWLNPCERGLPSPAVSLSNASPSANVAIVMKRGVPRRIRVDDAGQLLSRHEGKTPGAHLLLGVRSDAGIFHTASVVAQDPGGRDYSVTIPFDAKVNLVVASSFFRLTDGTGAAFAATGAAAVPVAVPSGHAPPMLRLAVSGHR